MDTSAKAELGGDADERRHSHILACLRGVAAGLLVATVLFFAVHERAELRFLLSKPAVRDGNSSTVALNVPPDNTVARNMVVDENTK